jgi:hypothetical protein
MNYILDKRRKFVIFTSVFIIQLVKNKRQIDSKQNDEASSVDFGCLLHA